MILPSIDLPSCLKQVLSGKNNAHTHFFKTWERKEMHEMNSDDICSTYRLNRKPFCRISSSFRVRFEKMRGRNTFSTDGTHA